MSASAIADLLCAAYRAGGYDAAVGRGASHELDAIVTVGGVVVVYVDGRTFAVDVRAEASCGRLVVPGHPPLQKRAA